MTTAEQPVEATEEAVRRQFRQNVVTLTQMCGISVRRAAGLADLSEATVRSWLTGEKDPTLGNLAKLADAFGVDAGDLLLDSEALHAKVEEVGLRPFVLPRPATTRGDSGSATRSSRHAKSKGGRGRIAAPGALLHTPRRPARTRPSITVGTSRIRRSDAA